MIIKLEAVQTFDDQEGHVEKGATFLVNEERARALIARKVAVRCDDQTIAVEGPRSASKPLGVPRPPEEA